MPIVSCTLESGASGYRWGSSGACYETRAEAEKQAAAAYANGYAGDALAMDRGLRSRDADGRLHVALSNLSKSNICPYYGREIPAPNLEPDRVYYMFRDPAELGRPETVASANNLPLMDNHIIVSADQPEQDRVVGSTGTDAIFDGEYLKNSLVVWVGDSIDRIESGEQKQISMAYRYVADMTPGEHKALRFDGIMRNIVFNHAALVPEGRAGPDVVVADAAPKDTARMISKKALLVRGALRAHLAPIMAADAKIDLDAALDGVTGATLKAMRPKIIERITTATKGKLIADAKLDGLPIVLDAMETEEVDGEDEMEEAMDGDDEPMTEAQRLVAEKAADKKAKDKRAKDKKAKDEGEVDKNEPKPAEDEDETEKEKAMDSRIKLATDAAVQATIDRMNAIAAAKRDVFPHVGELTAAFDSAAAVYKVALDAAHVDTKGVDPSAYPALVKMLRPADEPAPRIATDSAARFSVMTKFPALANIR